MNLTSENYFTATIVSNPFDVEDRVVERIPSTGDNLQTLLKDTKTEVIVSLNGFFIPKEKFQETIPRKEDQLVVVSVPAGGDDNGKSIMRMVAMIALTYFTMGAGTLFGTAGQLTAGQFVAASATFVAGTMLINKLLPPQMAEMPNQTLEDSPSRTYGVDGPKNTSTEGIVVPLVFGQFRMAGNIINSKTVNNGDKQTYLALYNAGEGEIAGIEDVQINDEPADNYNAELFVRRGTVDQDSLSLFNEASTQTNVGITQDEYGDTTTITTSSPSISLDVSLVFPSGLYKVMPDGKRLTTGVNVEILYKKTGDPDSELRILQTGSLLSYEPSVEFETISPITGDVTGTVFKTLEAKYSLFYEYEHLVSVVEDESIYETRVYDPRDFTDILVEVVNSVHSSIFNKATSERQYTPSAYRILGTRISDGERITIGRYLDVEFESFPVDNYNPKNGTAYFSGSVDATAMRYTAKSRPLESQNYTVIVTRKTAKPDNTSTTENPKPIIYNSYTVTDFGQSRVGDIKYVNTALLGVKVLITKQLNSIPKVTYLNKGLILKTYERDASDPTKFNLVLINTSNPAWIVYNMLTNERWGAKNPVKRLEFEEFYHWAEMCTNLGLEFNGVFDSSTNIDDATRVVAKIGRAKLIPVGTKIGVNILAERQMEQLFTSASILKDSLKINWLPTTDRANVIDCTFFDKENNYLQRTFRYHSDDIVDSLKNFRATNLTLYGVTSYEQAVRECILALNFNKLSQAITFDAFVQAISVRIGSIIGVQHDMPAWGVGGRITASTSRSLTLDRKVQMDAEKVYSVLLQFDNVQIDSLASVTVKTGVSNVLVATQEPTVTANRIIVDGYEDVPIKDIVQEGANWNIVTDTNFGFTGSLSATTHRTDAMVTRLVQNVVGETDVLTLETGQEDFPAVPASLSQFSFGENQKTVKKFMVTSISGNGTETRTISALEYFEGIMDDTTTNVITPNFSNFSTKQEPVLDIEVNEELVGDLSNQKVYVKIDWSYQPTNTVRRANVYVSYDEIDYVLHEEAAITSSSVLVEDTSESHIYFKIVSLKKDGSEDVINGITFSKYELSVDNKPLQVSGIQSSLLGNDLTVRWEQGKLVAGSPDLAQRYLIEIANVQRTRDGNGSLLPISAVPVYPTDYIKHESTLDDVSLFNDLSEDNRYYIAITAINAINPLLKSSEKIITFDTPEEFNARSSKNGFEIHYSVGVPDGQILGNPDSHPANWSQDAPSELTPYRHQAVLTWHNYSFNSWVVTTLSADAEGVVRYLGQLADYPVESVEGDMFEHTVDNKIYLYQNAAWVVFFDKNPNTFLAEYSANGIQDTLDPDYAWSSTFAPATHLFMRQSTDGGENWSASIRIVGEEGAGGSYVDYRFARGETAPTLNATASNPAGWSDAPPAGTENLWMTLVQKNTDGTLAEGQTWSTPVYLKGEKGDPGISYTGTIEYYKLTNSSTTPTVASGGWVTTPQNPTSTNRYLWNYNENTRSEGGSVNSPVSLITQYVKDGKGISSISEEYQRGSSSTTAPTGTWYSTFSAAGALTKTLPYMWNKTTTSYTEGDPTVVTTMIAARGDDGTTPDALTVTTETNNGVTTLSFSDGTTATINDGQSSGVKIIYADNTTGSNASFTKGSRKYVNYYEWTGAAPTTVPANLTYTLFVGEKGDNAGVLPIYADNASGLNATFTFSSQEFVNFYEWEGTAPTTVPADLTYVKFKGDAGSSIVWKGDLASHPANPEENWAYYNTTDKKSYIYNGTAWVLMTEDGQQGDRGAGQYAIVGSAWDIDLANSAVEGTKQIGDTVTIYDNSAVPPFTETRTWNGTEPDGWIKADVLIDGNLVVNGEAIINKLAVNAIKAEQIDVNDLFTKTISASGSITYSNSGKSVVLGGAGNLITAKNGSTPIFTVAASGAGTADGSWIRGGSLGHEAFNGGVIDYIRGQLGSAAPDTGGTESVDYTFTGNTTITIPAQLSHGSNSVAITFTGQGNDLNSAGNGLQPSFTATVHRNGSPVTGATFNVTGEEFTAFGEDSRFISFDESASDSGFSAGNYTYSIVISNCQNIDAGMPVSGTFKVVEAAAGGSSSYTLPTASDTELGGIKIGEGLSIDADGIVTAEAQALSPATTTTLGGVIVGDNLTVDTDGKIHAQTGALPTASASTKGGVKVGSHLTMSGEVLNVSTTSLALKSEIPSTAADVNARADTWVPSWTQVTGKPSIPSTAADVNARADTWVPSWSQVTGKPSIPSTAADVNARADTWVPSWTQVTGKPSIPSTAADVNARADTWVPSWSQVTGKPSIPTHTSDLTNNSGFVTATNHTHSQYADKNSAATQSFSGAISTNSTIYAGSSISGTNCTARSDRRIKCKIERLKDPLRILSGIAGYTYQLKEKLGVTQAHTIAQEVQAVFPEAVTQNEKGMLEVSLPAEIALLIEVCKEQQEEIETQRKEIDLLKEKIYGEC